MSEKSIIGKSIINLLSRIDDEDRIHISAAVGHALASIFLLPDNFGRRTKELPKESIEILTVLINVEHKIGRMGELISFAMVRRIKELIELIEKPYNTQLSEKRVAYNSWMGQIGIPWFRIPDSGEDIQKEFDSWIKDEMSEQGISDYDTCEKFDFELLIHPVEYSQQEIDKVKKEYHYIVSTLIELICGKSFMCARQRVIRDYFRLNGGHIWQDPNWKLSA